MANYRAKTEKQMGGAPPILMTGNKRPVDSIGGIEKHGTKYVQLRGMSWGGVSVFFREDILKKV